MNKKLFKIIIIILFILIIIIGTYLFLHKSNKEENEIKPQEEISDEQMRKTIVTIYYENKENKKLMPEGRMIDSKKLLSDPYTVLVNLLMEKPKNDKLQSTIPEGTRVLKTEIKGDIVYIDLSKEFIDKHEGGQEKELNTIYSIVNTLTELNEVNGIKILINGKENKEFKDKKINFRDIFVRTEEGKDKNDK